MVSASDIPKGNWVDRWVPGSCRPYARLARLDRPIGTWLLLLPCWWGVVLAGPLAPDPDGLRRLWLCVLFLVGAVAMRGAGCTINDLWDRNIDRRVARTSDRPIASGAVSVAAALAFLALQLLVGLLVLVQLPIDAILVGFGSMVFVVLYPLAKRVTDWPQLVLGITFNWGIWVGWSAAAGTVGLPEAPGLAGLPAAPSTWSVLPLYLCGLFWTLGYDTIYAHQDKTDDRQVGVRSTALLLGDASRAWIACFYVAMTALIALAIVLRGLGPVAWIGLLAVVVHLFWQTRAVDLDDPASCLHWFRSNRDTGLLVLATLALGWIEP